MEKKEEVSHNQQYDLVINGKSLAVSLVALRAARKGLRVILYSGEPKRGDGEFDYTQLFPFRISNLWKSKQEYRMIRYLQKMSPHLVIPQRHIAFYQKPPFPAFMLSGIDRIDGNSGENKSLLIRTAKSNDLSAICCDNYPWALTMREYKVDTERLTIELLKRFRSLGGLIQSGSISNLRQATTGMTFCEDRSGACLSTLAMIDIKKNADESLKFELENLNIRFKNRILLRNEDVDLAIDLRDESPFLFAYRGTPENINSAVSGLFKKDVTLRKVKEGISRTERDTLNLSKQVLDFKETGLRDLSQKVESLSRFVRSVLEVNIQEENVEPLAGSDYPFQGDYRILEELCDEKFDIAKQTGIQFNAFKKLFYRYGTQIDQMTDRAYELLEKSRDANIIWAQAEMDFLEQEEREITR